MKNVLDVKAPLINGLSLYTGLFSILPDNKEVQPWICNNFIQLRYFKEYNVIFFERHTSIFDYCPFFSHYKLSRKMIESKWNNITSFIKDMINMDSYVYLYADTFYISKYGSFQKAHIYHELFVYGYDDESCNFFCVDNLFGKHEFYECTYNMMDEAFLNVEGGPFHTDINCLTKVYQQEYPVLINFEQILKLTKEYTYSLVTTNFFEEPTCLEFGFKIHNSVLNNIKNIKPDNKKNIDIRPIHSIYEHKVMMLYRLEYINKNFNAPKLNEIIEIYKHLKDQYLFLRTLILKYNFTFESEILKNVITSFEKLISIEYEALEKLIIIYEALNDTK